MIILLNYDRTITFLLGLSLSCRQHSTDKFVADKPESFAARPEGGCNKPCDARLTCGHQCELMCHNYDFE